MAGEAEARLLQPLANMFEFPEDKVYCSPLRRAIETLCLMLDNHPQKSRLTVVLLPLAKEVETCGLENTPVPISTLYEEC